MLGEWTLTCLFIEHMATTSHASTKCTCMCQIWNLVNSATVSLAGPDRARALGGESCLWASDPKLESLDTTAVVPLCYFGTDIWILFVVTRAASQLKHEPAKPQMIEVRHLLLPWYISFIPRYLPYFWPQFQFLCAHVSLSCVYLLFLVSTDPITLLHEYIQVWWTVPYLCWHTMRYVDSSSINCTLCGL